MGGEPWQASTTVGLDRNAANHQPLTPLTLLERAAKVFPHRLAIVHGDLRVTYRDFWRRSLQLASALSRRGIGKGDTVTVMLSNTPAMLEAHHGVPMVKAVLHSLNTRLDAAIVAFQLDHAETKVLIVDREFSGVVKEALALAKVKPLVIDYDDPNYAADAPYPKGERIGTFDYEAFLAGGDPDFAWSMPDDEWDAISLNYTSGTTGNPKGVVYHHRGAALMAYANTVHAGMGRHPVYLWTLPMFHCNGWCFPWTLALQAGTHVCLRWVRARAMYDAIADHGVTHLCGAPIVMSTLINARARGQAQLLADRHLQHRRRAAARSRAGRHGRRRLCGDASLRPDRDLRPGRRQRMARRLERARRRRPRRAQGQARRALRRAGRAHRHGPGDDAGDARRRRDHRRGHVPRQHRYEGLSEEPESHRRGAAPAAGSTPATSA